MDVFHSLMIAGHEASVVRPENRFRLISQNDGPSSPRLTSSSRHPEETGCGPVSARPDQAGLVGDHYQLDAVTRAQLGQGPAYMGLRRGHAHV